MQKKQDYTWATTMAAYHQSVHPRNQQALEEGCSSLQHTKACCCCCSSKMPIIVGFLSAFALAGEQTWFKFYGWTPQTTFSYTEGNIFVYRIWFGVVNRIPAPVVNCLTSCILLVFSPMCAWNHKQCFDHACIVLGQQRQYSNMMHWVYFWTTHSSGTQLLSLLWWCSTAWMLLKTHYLEAKTCLTRKYMQFGWCIYNTNSVAQTSLTLHKMIFVTLWPKG